MKTRSFRRAGPALGLLVLLWTPILFAQPTVYEHEPNDTPAQATKVSGAVVLAGAMGPRDQDGYMWTVISFAIFAISLEIGVGTVMIGAAEIAEPAALPIVAEIVAAAGDVVHAAYEGAHECAGEE